MNAKEMFEKLGYELTTNGVILLTYYKGRMGLNSWEHKNTKPHLLYGTDKEIIFDKENKDFLTRCPSRQEDYEDCSAEINMQELQAINKQVEELGWLGSDDNEKDRL